MNINAKGCDGMKYIEDLESIKEKIKYEKQANVFVESMKQQVDLWINIFKDDPSKLSGWGHIYFCEEDGEKLVFDLDKPNSHICPICAKEYSGGKYDAAWIYMYRYEAILSAMKAAVLYKLYEDEKYIKYVKKVISFYSDNYDKFEVHGRGATTSGNGKITPQALNEAIFIVKVVNILELLKWNLEKEYVEGVTNKLLKTGAYFIDSQKKIIHNIPCWINAAVSIVGLFSEDKDLIYRGLYSEFGFENQVIKGVTKDYFWYEGSIHYNFFTIEAFMNTLLFSSIYNSPINEEVKKIVKNMIIVPSKYAFDNLVLPNPNDGWPNVSLKTYSFIYDMAAKIYDSVEIDNINNRIYSSLTPRYSVPLSQPIYVGEYSLEALLFSKSKEFIYKAYRGESYDFKTSNFAILKNNNINAFIKYGHCSPSHAHPDKMNVEIIAFGEVITRDLSNCGYDAKLCNEVHRTTAAHSTVMVNGQNHTSTKEGKTLCFDDSKPYIQVISENVYSGVDFIRSVELSSNKYTDKFTVKSNEIHTYDWIFHVEGTLETEIESRKGELGFSTNGYQHFKDIKKLKVKEDTELLWSFKNGVRGAQNLNTRSCEVFLCKSYDNPVNKYRNTVILRCKGYEAEFNQEWRFLSSGKQVRKL